MDPRPPNRDTRQLLLRAAAESFTAHGMRGTSLDTVARTAGVTRQGLLHYFPSKTALLLAVLADRDQQDTEFIQRVDRETGEGFGAVGAFLRRNRSDPAFARLFAICAAESVQPDGPFHEHFRNRYLRARELMAGEVRRGQARGEITPDADAESLAIALFALIDSLSLLQLLDPDLDASTVFGDVLRLMAPQDIDDLLVS